MQELLSQRKKLQANSAIVMPTGNNFANDMYGQITTAEMSDTGYAFGWQVLPNDRTSSYLEMWLPEGMDPSEFTVHISPPAGYELTNECSIPISADPSCADGAPHIGDPRRFSELEMNGENIGQLSADKHRNNRWRVMLALIPTRNVADQTRRNGGEQLKADQYIGV